MLYFFILSFAIFSFNKSIIAAEQEMFPAELPDMPYTISHEGDSIFSTLKKIDVTKQKEVMKALSNIHTLLETHIFMEAILKEPPRDRKRFKKLCLRQETPLINTFEKLKNGGISVFTIIEQVNIDDSYLRRTLFGRENFRNSFISAINNSTFIVAHFPNFVASVNKAAEQERKHRALAIQMHRAAKNMSYQESTQAGLGRNLALRIILNDPRYQCKEINLWHAIVTAPRGQELLTGLKKKNPWTPPPSLMSSCSIL